MGIDGGQPGPKTGTAAFPLRALLAVKPCGALHPGSISLPRQHTTALDDQRRASRVLGLTERPISFTVTEGTSPIVVT